VKYDGVGADAAAAAAVAAANAAAVIWPVSGRCLFTTLQLCALYDETQTNSS